VSRGILLVNLGTPASCSTADVRRYLGEFLMDPHVLDVPWPIRRLIVSCFILPFRPKRSAAAYRKIWDHEGSGTGSPLLHHGRNLEQALGARLQLPCVLAMRYGEPNLADAVAALEARGVTEDMTELSVLAGGKRFQHRPLTEQLLLNLLDPRQDLETRRQRISLDMADCSP